MKMPVETLRLFPTTPILLVMFTFRQMSGYEIKFVIVSPAYHKIYTELRLFESHGLGRTVATQWLTAAKMGLVYLRKELTWR
jgi:hypothetical protein